MNDLKNIYIWLINITLKDTNLRVIAMKEYSPEFKYWSLTIRYSLVSYREHPILVAVAGNLTFLQVSQLIQSSTDRGELCSYNCTQ